jgi:hypothetical protein
MLTTRRNAQDAATKRPRLFRPELPNEYASIALGWTSYQRKSQGLVAWFDDLAIDRERIGCGQ